MGKKIQKQYNGIYRKREGAGFCGEPAIVRTLSESEVFRSIILQLVNILARQSKDPSSVSEEQRLIWAGFDGVKSSEVMRQMVEDLYFEPCMLDCGNEGCREWHEVYSVTTGHTFCHVSDCELEEIDTPQPEEEEAIKGKMTFLELLEKELNDIMKIEGMFEACKERLGAEGTDEYLVLQKGRADVLQWVISVLKKQGGSDVKNLQEI